MKPLKVIYPQRTVAQYDDSNGILNQVLSLLIHITSIITSTISHEVTFEMKELQHPTNNHRGSM